MKAQKGTRVSQSSKVSKVSPRWKTLSLDTAPDQANHYYEKKAGIKLRSYSHTP